MAAAPDVGKSTSGAAAVLSKGYSAAYLAEICFSGRILDIVWDFRIEYESFSCFAYSPFSIYVIIIIRQTASEDFLEGTWILGSSPGWSDHSSFSSRKC
ncbi:hypothetical protein [uncultured Selenomonas sp.]|uniref:hypothetical protein n=1 Tax=uncultured Selenomonas sp. TaxID=159275 RepID=UPI002627FEEE|nr:hypothetical protein [uncultured Selenomonas sp.]